MPTYGGSISAAPAMPMTGSYVAPSMSYGLGMPTAAPMTTATMSYPAMGGSIAAPSVGGSIAAPIGGSISAPMSLPVSHPFSGYTATPFLPASSYNPATFGGPTFATTGVALPTPLANSVSSLPISAGYGGYSTYGAMTGGYSYGAPTYGTSYGTTYAPRTYGTSYGAPTYGTTYGATTYAAAPAPGTPTPA